MCEAKLKSIVKSYLGRGEGIKKSTKQTDDKFSAN